MKETFGFYLNMFLKSINSKRILISSFVVIFSVILLIFIFSVESKNTPRVSPFPDGKNFAFTITADPDYNILEKDRIIYDFLTSIGMRTTVAVWVKDATRSNGIPDRQERLNAGDSCEREEYLLYMQELQSRGFEIAMHGVSAGNDTREETIDGYEKFKAFFHHYPQINIMHQENLENLYWGSKVVNSRFLRALIGYASSKANFPFEGEVEGSKFFWGDIAKDKTKYIRLWGTKDINTLKYNPSMPYHDPQKPFVNYWFSYSDGRNAEILNKLISSKNIDKLSEERGASIVYTHFSEQFVENNKINETFQIRMRNLAANENGWFVPASAILDRLLLMKKIMLHASENAIVVTNFNRQDVESLTLLVPKESQYYTFSTGLIIPNVEGELMIGDLKGGETMVILNNDTEKYIEKEYPGAFEKFNLFLQRSLVYISHHF